MQTLLPFPSSHSHLIPSSSRHGQSPFPRAFPHQLSPRPKRSVATSSKGNADGRDWGGGIVDKDMVMLRRRIHEVRTAEDGGDGDLPSDWMEWEKEYYEDYVAGVCEVVKLLQTFLMNTRPSLAVGLTVLITLSVPTSVILIFCHLMDESRSIFPIAH